MTEKKIEVLPSLLAADFTNLEREVRRIEDSGADGIHLDIMDGHFVPNLTYGPKMVAAVRSLTDLFLDVHLMIYNPFQFVEAFVASGASRITFHIEATEDVDDVLSYIKRCNVEAGIAVNPETSLEMIYRHLDQFDMALLMTVNPGFGGQEFMGEVLDKIRDLRAFCEKAEVTRDGALFPIQVDGGIQEETGKQCIEAGATSLVAGTYLFGEGDMGEKVKTLR